MNTKKDIGVLLMLVLVHKVTIATVLASVSLIIILLYIFFVQYRDEIAFAVAVVVCAAMVYVGYFTAASVRQKADMEKKNRSFSIIRLFNSMKITKIRIQIEMKVSEKRQSEAPSALYQAVDKDKELVAGIRVLLGLFEIISIGIQDDYYDEEALYNSLGFLVPYHFDSLRFYIDQLRIIDKEERLYCETEKMRNAWQGRKSLFNERELPLPTFSK